MTLEGLGPSWLLILGVLEASMLCALHLLGRRRRRIVVPFLPLWVPTEGGRAVSADWARRLRRVGALILQLSILSLVLIAAGDPVVPGAAAIPRTVVLLIDRSASMQARDEPGTRLGRARELGRAIVDGLETGERMLIASFGAHFSTDTGFERDHHRLKAALDAIRPSEEPGELLEALTAAAALVRGSGRDGGPGRRSLGSRPTIILIGDLGGVERGGDGAARLAAELADLEVDMDVRFLPVGRRSDNLAIVAFSARRDPVDPSAAELVVVTQSFRTTPATVTLAVRDLTRPSSTAWRARRVVRLEPGARVVTTLSGMLPAPRFEAVIEGASDDLPLDDRAYAALAPAPRRAVLVVGSPDLYLDAALLGMASEVQMHRIPASELEDPRRDWARPELWARYDLVIFDGVTPNHPPDSGRFVFIDPSGPGSPWPAHGSVADPVITDVMREHAIVKHLGLSDLNVATARRLTLQGGDVAVASSLGAPLIVARDRPGLREIGLAFDLRRSDLPLRTAFPLLLSNALGWLTQRPSEEGLSHATGQTIRIEVRPRARGATEPPGFVDVVTPDQRTVRLPVVDGAVTVALDQIGIVEVLDAEGGERKQREDRVLAYAAVNLASPVESDLTPRRTLELPRGGLASSPALASPLASGPAPAPAPSLAAQPPSPRPVTQARPIRLVAMLAALMLLLLEWVTFHRPTPAR